MSALSTLPGAVPALEMRGISKRFPGVRALHQVSLTVYPGEVLALMGENGAGKSTLMKILAGAYTADEGEILVSGQTVQIRSPLEARSHGVHLIYQELNLARNLTVLENIFMGAERSKLGLLDRKTMRLEASRALEKLGASFGPDTPVSRLSVAEGQLVEIARALTFQLKLLVMDEPTAALSERETERLFEVIRTLKTENIGIVYISHRMAEVYALADRVSVLRDGEYIGTLERSGAPAATGLPSEPKRVGINAERVVSMMVGRPLKDFYEHRRRAALGETVLEVHGLTDGRKLAPAHFKIRAGEILGLAGLVGAGRTELARILFGADPRAGGEVWLEGQKIEVRSPSDAVKAGIGYVPENRKEQGLFLEMSSGNNISMNVLEKHSSGGVLNFSSLGGEVDQAIQNFAVKVSSPSARAIGLSGGNQQKLLLARWLAIQPKVLLLDEPTRGVDIGAKAEIYRIISGLAEQGVAVLFISSELPEVVGMSDRTLIMREGKLVGELDPVRGEVISQESIMEFATGLREFSALEWEERQHPPLERPLPNAQIPQIPVSPD